MSITVTCSGCGQSYRVPDSAAGKKLRCKNDACGQVIAITAQRQRAEFSGGGARQLKLAPPLRKSALPPRRRRAQLETEESEEIEYEERSFKIPVKVVAGIIAILLIGGGGIYLALTMIESSRAKTALTVSAVHWEDSIPTDEWYYTGAFEPVIRDVPAGSRFFVVELSLPAAMFEPPSDKEPNAFWDTVEASGETIYDFDPTKFELVLADGRTVGATGLRELQYAGLAGFDAGTGYRKVVLDREEKYQAEFRELPGHYTLGTMEGHLLRQVTQQPTETGLETEIYNRNLYFIKRTKQGSQPSLEFTFEEQQEHALPILIVNETTNRPVQRFSQGERTELAIAFELTENSAAPDFVMFGGVNKLEVPKAGGK